MVSDEVRSANWSEFELARALFQFFRSDVVWDSAKTEVALLDSGALSQFTEIGVGDSVHSAGWIKDGVTHWAGEI